MKYLLTLKMKIAVSVLLVVGSAFTVNAQITATLNRSTGGVPEIRIRNKSAMSLEAFSIYLNNPMARTDENNDPYIVFVDTAVDTGTRPLLPNEERTVPVLFRLRSDGKWVADLIQQPIVTAGIFSNGITTGDPVLLTRLILRRSNMLLAVETSLETLSDAGGRNIPREQLINLFKKLAESARRWYLPQEQQVGRGLYQSIVAKLMGLPEGQVGSAFPPSDFVAQEVAILHRQRVMLSQSLPSLADKTLMVSLGAHSN
jgi:hypothetical protein